MYERVFDRINTLRQLGVPERIYAGRSPFDGQSLELVASLSDGVDETAAPVNPNMGETYNSVFILHPDSHSYILSDGHLPYVPLLNDALGGNNGRDVPITEMTNGANIEARLIRNPITRDLHAFFFPSRKYVERLRFNLR